MNMVEIEQRLKVTETALNEALKEIENLKSEKNEFKLRGNLNLKSQVPEDVFENVFNFDFDRQTGEASVANNKRKHDNFKNLYNNILMGVGYCHATYNSAGKCYYAKADSFKDIPVSDYTRLEKLMGDIVMLMYNFKRGDEE